MKKVGICTVYTGFNYGSALQAAATKNILRQLGYHGDIIKLSGSLIAGRDIRIKKMISLGWNLLRNLPQAHTVIRTYAGNNKTLSSESNAAFTDFYNQYIQPVMVTESRLKKSAQSDEYTAFLCGSDQVWNASTYYVDPFYYLSFTPKHKRIAFAPSFGRSFIPERNKKKILSNIAQIPWLSVREESGGKLIRELLNREAQVLLDPTLVLDKEAWSAALSLSAMSEDKKYALAYFLDEPSKKAKKMLRELSAAGFTILSLPYERQGDWFDRCVSAGPREFLQYVLGADVICTDSFHGTAFSVNFEKEFYVFEREYGGADNQSSRVTSLLERIGLMGRFNRDSVSDKEIDYTFCRTVLETEREKSRQYLRNALNEVEATTNG